MFAATVDQLLGERERHGDEVVVEFLDSLRLGTTDCELHHVRRTSGGRGEQIDLRSRVPPLRGTREIARGEGRELRPGRRRTPLRRRWLARRRQRRTAGQAERPAQSEYAGESDADHPARRILIRHAAIRYIAGTGAELVPLPHALAIRGNEARAEEGL